MRCLHAFGHSTVASHAPCTPPCTTAASCGYLQADINLSGADLPDGGLVAGIDSFAECCGACKSRRECDAYTYSIADRTCYLKSSIRGFEVRAASGMQSAIKPAAPTLFPPSSSPSPSPAPSPPPPPALPPVDGG